MLAVDNKKIDAFVQDEIILKDLIKSEFPGRPFYTSAACQVAEEFANGLSKVLWNSPLFQRKQKLYFAQDEAGLVLGLLRLEIHEDSVHIAQVAGFPGAGAGGDLVEMSKAVALSLNQYKVDLGTADK